MKDNPEQHWTNNYYYLKNKTLKQRTFFDSSNKQKAIEKTKQNCTMNPHFTIVGGKIKKKENPESKIKRNKTVRTQKEI